MKIFRVQRFWSFWENQFLVLEMRDMFRALVLDVEFLLLNYV